MKNKYLITATSNRKKKEYEIIFDFKDENTNTMYLGYTENEVDEYGNILVYASKFSLENEDVLLPLETEEEWDIIETIFSKLPEMN